jgi:hypothetical protein
LKAIAFSSLHFQKRQAAQVSAADTPQDEGTEI